MNNQFYRAVEMLRERLSNNPNVNTTLFGRTEEKDLYKKNIYPIAHIVTTEAPMNVDGRTNAVSYFSFEIACLDQRDISKSIAIDKFEGNDNLQDNLNITYTILNDLVSYLKYQNNDMGISLYDVSNFTPLLFTDHNLLDGWYTTVTLAVPVIDPLDDNSADDCY